MNLDISETELRQRSREVFGITEEDVPEPTVQKAAPQESVGAISEAASLSGLIELAMVARPRNLKERDLKEKILVLGNPHTAAFDRSRIAARLKAWLSNNWTHRFFNKALAAVVQHESLSVDEREQFLGFLLNRWQSVAPGQNSLPSRNRTLLRLLGEPASIQPDLVRALAGSLLHWHGKLGRSVVSRTVLERLKAEPWSRRGPVETNGTEPASAIRT